MKNQPAKSVLLSLATAASLFQGCIAQRIMDSEDRKNYSDYRMSAERLNMEREKAGLQPQNIQTFEEWRGSK
jgi:hypothetical protein